MTVPSTDVSDALSSTSAAVVDVADAPVADPMTKMWNEAVVEWQRKTGVDLAAPSHMHFGSKEAVMDYITEMEGKEPDEFANGRWKRIRDSFIPLARIFETLCVPIADTLCSTVSGPPWRYLPGTDALDDRSFLRAKSYSQPWG